MHAINNDTISYNKILSNLDSPTAGKEDSNRSKLTPLQSLLSLEDRFFPELDGPLQTYQLLNDYLVPVAGQSVDFLKDSKVTCHIDGTFLNLKELAEDSPYSFVMKIDQPSFFKERGAGSSHILVNVGLELSEWEEALVIYHHRGTGEHRLGLVAPNSPQFQTERFKHLFAYRPFQLEEMFAIKAIYPIVARKFVPASELKAAS